jgi:hypothetical protein
VRRIALTLGLLAIAGQALAQSGTRIVSHSMPDFLEGELEGLSVGPVGELAPAPVRLERFFTPALYVWSLALDRKGRVVAGVGDDGAVVRQADDGFEELAKFEGQIVMDVVDGDDGLLAATGPEGRVYRIDENGSAAVLDREETTVWTLAPSADGNRWLAGTGPDAFLVRFDAGESSEGQVLNGFEATVVRKLARDGDRLWMATQGPALIYQTTDDPDLPDRLRHDAGNLEIPDLVPDGDGGLWFLVLDPGNPDQLIGPSSRLMHLPAEGSAETVWEGDIAVMSLARAADGALLVGEIGESRVHRIGVDGRIGLWRDFGEGDASALLTDGDVTWVGSSNLGDVFRLAPPDNGRGTFTCAPIGTPAVQTWGRLWVEGSEGRVRFAARSGMRSEPDDSWSEWSGWKESGQVIDAPLADFLQYRVSVEDAEITGINVAWARRNHGPRIRGIFFAPDPSEYDWSDSQDDGYGNGNGNSGNGGSVSHLRALGLVRVDAVDPDRDPVKVTVEVQREGKGAWFPLTRDSSSLSVDWDTKRFEDGVWRARATVTDELESSTLVSPPVRIDNTAPRLGRVERGASALRFRIEDEGSRLGRVEVRVDEAEEWSRVEPDDGVTDGDVEDFSIALAPSAVAVWIRVRDAAGNEVVFSPRLVD